MMAPRAHSSMAEQPAHNRSDLGSSPGGPTVVAGAAGPARSVGGLRRGATRLRSSLRIRRAGGGGVDQQLLALIHLQPPDTGIAAFEPEPARLPKQIDAIH